MSGGRSCCHASGRYSRWPGRYPACVARENRYDVMIVLEMDRAALVRYDESEMHHRWKDEFGGLLEKKAIFDYE